MGYVLCIRISSVLLKITSDLLHILKILFELGLACLCTTVTLQTQLIDKKNIFVS